MRKTTYCCSELWPILRNDKFIRILQYTISIVFLTSSISKTLDISRTSLKIHEYLNLIDNTIGHVATDILAICLITLEMTIGLLFMQRIIPRCLQRLTIAICCFFTILTFYIALEGSINNCGCFGEILALSPWESFYKNILCLVVSIVIYYSYKFKPSESEKSHITRILLAGTTCFVLTLYIAIFCQPLKDFSRNKIGDTIAQTSDDIRIPLSIEPYSNFTKSSQSPNLEKLIYSLNKPLLIVVYNGNQDNFHLCLQEFKKVTDMEASKVVKILLSPIELPGNNEITFDYAGLADKNFLEDLIPGEMGILLVNNGVILKKKSKSYIGKQTIHLK